MKATLLLNHSPDPVILKARDIQVHIEQGLLYLSDGASKSPMYFCQQADIKSITIIGNPKSPKKAPETTLYKLMSDLGKSKQSGDGIADIFIQKLAEWLPKPVQTSTTVGETLTVDVSADIAKALIEELEKLSDDPESTLIPMLIDQITPHFEEALTLIVAKQLDNFYENRIDTQFCNWRQQLENLNDNMESLAKELAPPVIVNSLEPSIAEPAPLNTLTHRPRNSDTRPTAANYAPAEPVPPTPDWGNEKPADPRPDHAPAPIPEHLTVVTHQRIRSNPKQGCRHCGEFNFHKSTCEYVQSSDCEASVPVA